MTVPPVYLWNDNYYCEGDIVFELTDHEPWSAWVDAGHPPGTDHTEDELNSIARRFRVNRNSESALRRRNFPVLLKELPPPGSFCRTCMRVFTLPDDIETTAGRPAQTERNTVSTATNMQTALTRHALAMLHPEGEHERTLSHLFTELGRLADRYPNDYVMVTAIEKLGSAIIVLLNGEVGRLDQGALDKQVRDTVRRAGGDEQEL